MLVVFTVLLFTSATHANPVPPAPMLPRIVQGQPGEGGSAKTPLTQPRNTIDIATYSGAAGDGVMDDTARVQRALTVCSDLGWTCVIPANKTFLVTREIYMWGGANLVGTDATSKILLSTGSVPYILNIGISGVQQLKPKWTGTIDHVTFQGVGAGSGRIVFFWRSEGATLSHNVFDVGAYHYGPTSSGNNNAIVVDGNMNYIRKNITITDNTILATGTDVIGSEGIGLGQWDGAEIARNTVSGVGDDMIGIHFSNNINIHDNNLSGVDGRLFVSNSRHVTIANNKVARMASGLTGLWYQGIALLYIGHEANATNNNYAPTNITVQGNTLTYPAGAIDNGAAIYIYGPRNVTVINNTVVNNSSTINVTGLHLLPHAFTGGAVWTDPGGLDPTTVSRVHDVTISGNNLSAGAYHLPLVETGALCTHYVGVVTITNNTARGYSFICNPVNGANITN